MPTRERLGVRSMAAAICKETWRDLLLDILMGVWYSCSIFEQQVRREACFRFFNLAEEYIYVSKKDQGSAAITYALVNSCHTQTTCKQRREQGGNAGEGI